MKELYIDPNWNFKDFVLHIRALKSKYEEILASFCYLELKEKVNFKRQVRNKINSFHFKNDKTQNENLCNLLWEYMNEYCPIEALIARL